uniref:(California timema) hypothetical protein n=1 Tax=Timema californicum TaxID=61474 RepID=A0A7R9IWG2_TIMCA|nr:unnamed protein product [Timema californicum]
MTPGPGKTKWNVPASEIARNTNNPIRNIVENLRLDPNPDKPLIALSIGELSVDFNIWSCRSSSLAEEYTRVDMVAVPTAPIVNALWPKGLLMYVCVLGDPTVFGNLLPSPEVLDAVRESLGSLRYNGYAPSVGEWNQPRHDTRAVSRASKSASRDYVSVLRYIEAREAVARYSSSVDVTVDPKDVLLCSGCSGALDLCITALANPGQNILVPRPGFSIYRTLAEGLGIKVKSYNLKPERGWMVDLDHLEEQCDEKTAAIIINNPSNPCGSVFNREHLFDILEVARRNFLPIIADEIYEHMVFPGKEFHSLGSLSLEVPVLSCSGLTKRFLIPGWRMGWIIIHDRNGVFDQEVRKGLQRLSQRIIGSNTLVQGALPAILKNTPQEFYYNTLCILQTVLATDRREGLFLIHSRTYDLNINLSILRENPLEVSQDPPRGGSPPGDKHLTGRKAAFCPVRVRAVPTRNNALVAFEMLKNIEGLRPVMPEGAMYIMVGINMEHFPEFSSELHFLEQMVTEESVFCLPGQCFDYPGYMRLVLSVPEEQLREACHRIANYCARHFTISSISPYLVQRKHSLPCPTQAQPTLTTISTKAGGIEDDM